MTSKRYYVAAYRTRDGRIIPYGHEVLDRDYAERETADINELEAGTDEDPMFVATRLVPDWEPLDSKGDEHA